jgi:hypothetical protein
MNNKQRHLVTLITSAICFAAAVPSLANERRFSFTYGTTTAPAGAWEMEEQFRWESGRGFDSFSFKQELEYGVTDRLQLALYFYNVEHTREANARATAWTGSSIEAVYRLTDVTRDAFGSALYGEVAINDRELELESKLLLEKRFGPVTVAYNGVVEAHWESGYAQSVGVLEQTLGVCYEFSPHFSFGLEAKQEVALEEWRHSGGNAVFVGPNISFRRGDFFAAATSLFRVTDVPGEPRIELGVVLGLHF